jgi:hypothetical protein
MIDPTTLATILQSVGQAGSLSSMAAPPLPVSAIQQAPAQLAAMNSGGITNLGSALGSTGGMPSSVTPTSVTPTGGSTAGQSQSKTFQQKLADQYKTVQEQTPSHHALVSSGAQFVPMDFGSSSPYAPVPSSLFDMLQSMYGG